MSKIPWIDVVVYFIGMMTALGLVITTVMLAYHQILYAIKEYKRKYKIKHRFDKPPLAKCYCVDCNHYLKHNCSLHGIVYGLQDDFLCKYAEPK